MKSILEKIFASDILKLFTIRPFLFFLLSVVFSQVAFNMMNVILIFLIFFLTGSNFLVSLLLLISLLPQVFLSFLGGVIADAGDKKRILVWVNIIRALIIGILFFITNSPTMVYVVAFFVSVATQFYIPAETPVIPKLVPEKYLIPANSLFGLALFGSILVGFVIAGPAVTTFGRAGSFLVVVLLFMLAGVFANLIPSRLFKEESVSISGQNLRNKVEDSVIKSLVESYKTLKETRGTVSSFALLTISQVVIFILAIIVPGYASNVLKIDAESVSIILFAPAALGMVIAALLIGTVFEKANRDAMMNIGLLLSGVALFTFPLFPSLMFLIPSSFGINILMFVVVAAFIGGIGNASIFIPAQATIQEKIPEHFRSKIYGLLFAIIGFFSLLPMLIVGGLADTIGVNLVLYVIGAVIIFSGVAQAIALRSIKSS